MPNDTIEINRRGRDADHTVTTSAFVSCGRVVRTPSRVAHAARILRTAPAVVSFLRAHRRARLARAAAAALLLAGAGAATLPAVAQDQRSATVSGEVDAARWKGIRLKRLPRGASLGVELEVDGTVELLLLGERAFRRFPEQESPAFSSRVVERMGVSMKIPASGDYYLILDNRAGDAKRVFTITISAAPPGG